MTLAVCHERDSGKGEAESVGDFFSYERAQIAIKQEIFIIKKVLTKAGQKLIDGYEEDKMKTKYKNRIITLRNDLLRSCRTSSTNMLSILLQCSGWRKARNSSMLS